MADLFPTTVRAPSYSPQNTPKVNIVSADFGDGYSQRTPEGLNYIKDNWNVPWNALPNSEAQTLIGFLKAHYALPFLWTPPREAVAKKFICTQLSYSPTNDSQDYTDVSASFEQVFDIG